MHNLQHDIDFWLYQSSLRANPVCQESDWVKMKLLLQKKQRRKPFFFYYIIVMIGLIGVMLFSLVNVANKINEVDNRTKTLKPLSAKKNKLNRNGLHDFNEQSKASNKKVDTPRSKIRTVNNNTTKEKLFEVPDNTINWITKEKLVKQTSYQGIYIFKKKIGLQNMVIPKNYSSKKRKIGINNTLNVVHPFLIVEAQQKEKIITSEMKNDSITSKVFGDRKPIFSLKSDIIVVTDSSNINHGILESDSSALTTNHTRKSNNDSIKRMKTPANISKKQQFLEVNGGLYGGNNFMSQPTFLFGMQYTFVFKHLNFAAGLNITPFTSNRIQQFQQYTNIRPLSGTTLYTADLNEVIFKPSGGVMLMPTFSFGFTRSKWKVNVQFGGSFAINKPNQVFSNTDTIIFFTPQPTNQPLNNRPYNHRNFEGKNFLFLAPYIRYDLSKKYFTKFNLLLPIKTNQVNGIKNTTKQSSSFTVLVGMNIWNKKNKK